MILQPPGKPARCHLNLTPPTSCIGCVVKDVAREHAQHLYWEWASFHKYWLPKEGLIPFPLSSSRGSPLITLDVHDYSNSDKVRKTMATKAAAMIPKIQPTMMVCLPSLEGMYVHWSIYTPTYNFR